MYKNLKTKKDLKSYVRCVIDEIGKCDSIKKYHNEHWDLFMFLFLKHRNYPENFQNIVDIQIRYNLVFKKQLETYIIKNNGDELSVSIFKSCISSPKGKDKLSAAMRNAVYPQILDFKNNNSLVCDICDSINNIEIDHHTPQFIELKTTFINEIYKDKIPIVFSEDLSHCPIFTNDDIKFKNEWYNYHIKNAKLRPLCKKCNLSRPKIRLLKS